MLFKYSSSGLLLWFKTFASAFADHPGAIVESNGFVYVSGRSYGSVVFGEGTSAVTVPSGLWLAKYTSAGEFVWVQSLSSSASNSIESLYVEHDDYVYAAGTMQVSMLLLPYVDKLDVFACKLGAQNGTVLWARHAGGAGSDEPAAISVSNDGFVYMTAHFSGSVSITTGVGSAIIVSNGSSTDPVVIKYTTDGMLVWLRRSDGGSSTYFSASICSRDGSCAGMLLSCIRASTDCS